MITPCACRRFRASVFRTCGEFAIHAGLQRNLQRDPQPANHRLDGECGHPRMPLRLFGRVRNVHEATSDPAIAQRVHQSVEDVVAHIGPGGLRYLRRDTGFTQRRKHRLDRKAGEVGRRTVLDDFAVDRLRSGMAFAAQKSGRPVAEIEAESLAQIPARRFGTPEEFGELCAFICSAQASYITGQNFLIDGGLYPGTF